MFRINHHQGAHTLCFAKVTLLISVYIYVVNDDFGAVARCVFISCTV